MQTIKVITHYFGKLPDWYRLFLRTCEWNATIQWVVVTDQRVPWQLGPNIDILPMTLTELAALASENTGYTFPATSGYRVGDWRPAFGEIFIDALCSVDIWGHCDPDVFFGDIRALLNDNLLNECDVLSPDTRMLCGAFTLYRNSAIVNSLYRNMHDYQNVLDGQYDPGFDELGMERLLRDAPSVRTQRLPLGSYCEICHKILCNASGLYLDYTRPALMYHFRAVKGNLIMQCPEEAVSWALNGNILSEAV